MNIFFTKENNDEDPKFELADHASDLIGEEMLERFTK